MNETFSKRIKDLRVERDLTMDMVVYDLKQRYNIEISKSHLSRWENAKNEPSVSYASYLAKYYGVSLDYLIGLTDNKAPVNLLVKNKTKNN